MGETKMSVEIISNKNENKETQVTEKNKYDIAEISAGINAIQKLMSAHLKNGEHYGKIPGTEKNTLLKPGAEKLGQLFRLRPEFETTKITYPNISDGLHIGYEIRCTLYHIETGKNFGQGVGSASTLEKKYRWRNSKPICQKCGKEAIFKSKFVENEHYCYAKLGGCGAKFQSDKFDFETKKTENEDIADCYNTVLKMAKKRSFTDAILQATAASDIFVQDMEDDDNDNNPAPPKEKALNPEPQKEKPEFPTRKNFQKWYENNAGQLLIETINTVQSVVDPQVCSHHATSTHRKVAASVLKFFS